MTHLDRPMPKLPSATNWVRLTSIVLSSFCGAICLSGLAGCNGSAGSDPAAAISAEAQSAADNYTQLRASGPFKSSLSELLAADPSTLLANAGDSLTIGSTSYNGLKAILDKAKVAGEKPFDGASSIGAYLKKNNLLTADVSASDFHRAFTVLRAFVKSRGDGKTMMAALPGYGEKDFIKTQNVAAIYDVLLAQQNSDKSLGLANWGAVLKATGSGLAKSAKAVSEHAPNAVAVSTSIAGTVACNKAYKAAVADYDAKKTLIDRCSAAKPDDSACSKDDKITSGAGECAAYASWNCSCGDSGCKVLPGVSISGIELPPKPEVCR